MQSGLFIMIKSFLVAYFRQNSTGNESIGTNKVIMLGRTFEGIISHQLKHWICTLNEHTHITFCQLHFTQVYNV